MAKNRPPNELVAYTKWLSKWLSAVALVFCTLGVIGWTIIWFIHSKVPMIAIQCKGERIQSLKGDLYLYFLVQKERFSDKPYGIYFGAHTREDFNRGTEINDIVLGSKLESSTDNHYIFGSDSSEVKYRINRKTLLVEHIKVDDDNLGVQFPIKSCGEITSKKFYEETGHELDRKKRELKF